MTEFQPIQHASDATGIMVVRSWLPGRFIARDLSRLLIFILLILTPLTYSNDAIPNFHPDGFSRISPATKTRRIAAVTQPAAPAAVIGADAATAFVTPHAPSSHPHSSPAYPSQPSRAPPA